MLDVIIIGGGYAGLAAALQLGRARRSVLVLDAGERRNRFASHAHGFLGSDGVSPDLIAARGLADVLAYGTVDVRTAKVTGARRLDEGFAVSTGDAELHARRLIIATGVRDVLPPVPGLWERWGKTAFHCPYCHGYELARGTIAVLASSAMALHLGPLAAEWGGVDATTLLTNGSFELDDDARETLARHRVAVDETPVVAVGGEAPKITVQLADGRALTLDGLFVQGRTTLGDELAASLGCALVDGPIGPYYQIDPLKQTTAPGVFACGDAATPAGSIALAVADGTFAGVAAHRSLVFGLDAPTGHKAR